MSKNAKPSGFNFEEDGDSGGSHEFSSGDEASPAKTKTASPEKAPAEATKEEEVTPVIKAAEAKV